jgi:hypothetical protein
MGGQFAPEKRWSVYSGKQPKSNLFIGGQFTPESGGQFDRILQNIQRHGFLQRLKLILEITLFSIMNRRNM